VPNSIRKLNPILSDSLKGGDTAPEPVIQRTVMLHFERRAF
jgi:hypothetical protein